MTVTVTDGGCGGACEMEEAFEVGEGGSPTQLGNAWLVYRYAGRHLDRVNGLVRAGVFPFAGVNDSWRGKRGVGGQARERGGGAGWMVGLS